jgi:hypothetical protein
MKVKTKPRIFNVMQAIEQTSPSALASRMVPAANAKAKAAAKTAKLVSTMSGIDKLTSDMVIEETVVAAEQNMSAVPDKGKEVVDASSEEKDFDLRHLGGQELSEADKENISQDLCSSVGLTKKLWDVFAIALGQK